jgi:hypothetical protein
MSTTLGFESAAEQSPNARKITTPTATTKVLLLSDQNRQVLIISKSITCPADIDKSVLSRHESTTLMAPSPALPSVPFVF